jgi:hypothetical protein
MACALSSPGTDLWSVASRTCFNKALDLGALLYSAESEFNEFVGGLKKIHRMRTPALISAKMPYIAGHRMNAKADGLVAACHSV